MIVSVRLPNRVLLLTDNRETSDRVRSAVDGLGTGTFVAECANTLADAIARLRSLGIDIVILDLPLAQGDKFDCVRELVTFLPRHPVLILAHSSEEELARKAVELGAQDYLLHEHLESYSLSRARSNAVQLHAAEDPLYVEMDRASVTLNSIGDAVLCTDLTGAVTYLNLVAERLTGWSREDAAGHPSEEIFRIIDGLTRQAVPNPLRVAMKQASVVSLTPNCVLIGKGGLESGIEDSTAPIHDQAGKMIGAVIVFHDVSAARATSLKLTHSASLTDLPNGILLRDRIEQSVALSHRKHRPFAVLFLDLDHFKAVNDSFGHAVGSELLEIVAQRLVRTLRGSDTVSRVGGDEFAILLPEIKDASDASAAAKKMLNVLAAPFLIETKSILISASIGISLYPHHGDDAVTLLHSANLAMYRAREIGRNTFQFFSPELDLQVLARQSMESSLRRALEQEEFRLYYQPKVSLATNEITGAEALIRWQEPKRGLLLPADFISNAESTGLIVEIGKWVMLEACRQAKVWQQLQPALTIAVNVSAPEFLDKDFIECVKRVLLETDLYPGHLQLELTEGVLMKDAEETIAVLNELKAIGVLLAVDDFGTGYSSLSYLRQFPIDILKIDRSFIKQINSATDDSVLVSAIIGMGQSLRYLVVAEGVETVVQKTYLQTQQCAEGQGYLFSRPVPPWSFAQLLENQAHY